MEWKEKEWRAILNRAFNPPPDATPYRGRCERCGKEEEGELEFYLNLALCSSCLAEEREAQERARREAEERRRQREEEEARRAEMARRRKIQEAWEQVAKRLHCASCKQPLPIQDFIHKPPAIPDDPEAILNDWRLRHELLRLVPWGVEVVRKGEQYWGQQWLPGKESPEPVTTTFEFTEYYCLACAPRTGERVGSWTMASYVYVDGKVWECYLSNRSETEREKLLQASRKEEARVREWQMERVDWLSHPCVLGRHCPYCRA